MRWLIAFLVFLIALSAQAAPPEHTDPALHEFFESQKIPSTSISCCSVSDGRVVEYRIRNGHFEVNLTKEAFEFLDDTQVGWKAVDDRSVISGKDNPIGKAVAWVAKQGYNFSSVGRSFKAGDVMCLLLPSLT